MIKKSASCSKSTNYTLKSTLSLMLLCTKADSILICGVRCWSITTLLSKLTKLAITLQLCWIKNPLASTLTNSIPTWLLLGSTIINIWVMTSTMMTSRRNTLIHKQKVEKVLKILRKSLIKLTLNEEKYENMLMMVMDVASIFFMSIRELFKLH